MSKDTSSLILPLDYGNNVTEVSQDDFNVDGTLKNMKSNIVVVVFGSPLCRFCISMQSEFKKFADYAITNKLVSNVVTVNISKNTQILNNSVAYKWPFELNRFPVIIFYADGKPCYRHQLDYTYDSFMDSVSKVNSANPQCKLV